MGLIGLTADKINVGETATYSKTITETDVYLFAGISGDMNPAHINEEHCKGTKFKTRIAHGLVSVSLLSAIFGMTLPGPGTLFLENYCKFLKPVFLGDTITAEVIVTEVLKEKHIVKFDTKCVNQDGIVVIEGSAVVMAPRK